MFKALKQTLWGALFGCLIATQALGQATLLPNAKQQFFTPQGIPAAAGTVDMYVPSTTTRKTTWKSSSETVGNQNTNPVLLDAGGFAQIYGDGQYRQVVKDADGNTIWDAVTASTGSGGGGGGGVATGDGDLVGTVKPWAGLAAPNQYLFAFGQAVSRTTYSALLTAVTLRTNVICTNGLNILSGITDTQSIRLGAPVEVSCLAPGTTVTAVAATSVTVSANASVSTAVSATFFPFGNGDRSTTFNLPDLRGNVVAGRNNMGGTASTALNTTAYTACPSCSASSPNALGAPGGASTKQLLLANLPAYTPAGNITNGAITSTFTGATSQQALGPGGGSEGFTTGSLGHSTPAGTIGNSQAISVFIGAPQGGTGDLFPIVQPTTTMNYVIKVLPDTNSLTASGVTALGGMTGDIACGSGLTCTGNVVSSALPLITAANVYFAQTGTGSTTIALDTLLRNWVFTPEMFGGGCSASDSGPSIQAAINAAGALALGPGTVELAPCGYTIITPVVDPFGVRLIGNSVGGTFLIFAPASGGQIAYRVRNAGNIVTGGSMENVFFYTNNTTVTKVAIEVEDVSHYTFKNIRIGGATVGLAALWGGGGNSIGLRTRGREFIQPNGMTIAAEIPIEIAKNPNSTIDLDFGDFRNLNLIAAAGSNNITFDDALSITRSNFSDISMNGGQQCIYWINSTGTIPSDGNTFNNIGCEQKGTGAVGYNYVIEGNATGLIRNLTLSGYHLLDGFRNGPIFRNITDLNISGSVFYQGPSPLLCMDVDNSVHGLSWSNSRFQGCSIANFLGQSRVSAADLNAGQALPDWANYASNLDSGVLMGANGAFANSATLPIVLNATTGVVSCPSCVATAGSALTKTDDTNVTLTLGGSPTTALLAATSITAGWTGTLAASRGGTGISSLGTGVATAFGVNVGSAGALITFNGAGGTPSSITLTNGTGLPLSTGVTGAGTGVLAALATNVGTAGSIVVNGGALGTPSSGIGTNITNVNAATLGGATFAAPGAIGSGTPGTGAFTTLTASTYNGNTFTTGTGTLTIAAGKTLTISNSLTLLGVDGKTLQINSSLGLSGSDGTVMTFPTSTATIARTDAGQTFTGTQVFGTISPTTVNAFTLGGTISGGGNQINNVIIGTTTPLAGSFTTLSASTSVTSPLHYGGSGAASTLTLGSTSGAGTTDAIIGQTASQVERFRITTAGLFNIGPNVAPDTLLTVNGNTGAPVASSAIGGTAQVHLVAPDTTIGGVAADVYGAQGVYANRHSGGTQAAKTASAAATQTFGFAAQHWDTTAYFTSAGIDFGTLNTQSATDHSGFLRVRTVATGTTTYAERLRVQQGLSIGDTTDPGAGGLRATGATIQLTALGNDTATVDATVCRVAATGLLVTGTGALGICLGTSGRQFKTAFAPMTAGIDDLMKINIAQNYYYRDGFGDSGARMQYGPTAQDVEKGLPDLVRYNEKGEAINYDSGALLFIGLRAIQQLKADNDNFESRLARLESRK